MGLEIKRTFDDVHFRPAVAAAAFSKLRALIPESYPGLESFDGSLESAQETEKFSNVADFIASARDDLTLKDFWYRRGRDYALTISRGSSFSYVTVGAPSRGEVDAVLALLDAAAETCRIPKQIVPEANGAAIYRSTPGDRRVTATKTESWSRCCVLDNNMLERLDASISRWAPRITYQFDCRDGIQRTVTRLEDLLSFENPPTKAITKLRITGRPEDFSSTITVRFNSDDIHNVGVYLEGADEMVRDFVETLKEQLEAAKPWYSIIARAQFRLLIAPLVALAFWLFILARAVPRAAQEAAPSLADLVKITLPQALAFVGLTAIIVLLPQLIGWALDVLKRFAFPMTVFAIGQGVKRQSNREILRTVVIVAFVVSIVASLVLEIFR